MGGRKKVVDADIISIPAEKEEGKHGEQEEQATEDIEEKDEEAEEDEEEEEEAGKEEEKEEEGASKLDDGYYEIEDIRKKRVVKGQLQYLIKWRGWPETANTWEPYHNIQSCADIIHSFEQRYRDQPRKRKRKSSSAPVTITKKRRNKLLNPNLQPQLNGANVDDAAAPGETEVGGNEENHTTSGAKNKNAIDVLQVTPSPGITAERRETNGKQQQQQQQQQQEEEENAEVDTLSFGCTEVSDAAADLSVNLRSILEEDGSTNVPSNVKCPGPTNPSAGARRRKSARVKRFHPSSAPPEKVVLGVEDVDSPVDDKLLAGSTDPSSSVAKILMPVEFSASMSNNTQDVSVTFKALCSDGKEVLVTNKALKVINPQLLISFYEQHLRYGPA